MGADKLGKEHARDEKQSLYVSARLAAFERAARDSKVAIPGFEREVTREHPTLKGVVGRFTPNKEIKDTLAAGGFPAPTFNELAGPDGAKQFFDLRNKFQASTAIAASVVVCDKTVVVTKTRNRELRMSFDIDPHRALRYEVDPIDQAKLSQP